MAALQFAPWSSDIELAFYAALANLKINHDRLDDSARKVLGLYEVRPGDTPERSARMQIHGNAFTTNELPKGNYRAEGILKNFNTIEEYKNVDRPAVIERAGRTIWDAIKDSTIYSCPSLLASFYAISFADLKKYKFTYHFAFPAIHSDPPWKPTNTNGDFPRLSAKETTGLVDTVQTWKYGVDPRQHGFFLAKRVRLDSLNTP
ncbi:Autophagy protein 7, partial [Coniosporium uncinatum]